jgi:hypothetical protein
MLDAGTLYRLVSALVYDAAQQPILASCSLDLFAMQSAED